MSKPEVESWSDFSLLHVDFRRWQFEAALEAKYRASYVKMVAPLRVRAQFVTLPLWLAFILGDCVAAYIASDYRGMLPTLPIMRLVVFLGQIFFFFLSKVRRFSEDDAYANKVEIVGNIFTYAGMCVITGYAVDPYDLLYFFTGLLVCMVGSFSSSGLRTKEAIYLAIWLGLCSFLTLIWCGFYKDRSIELQAVHYYPIATGVFMLCFTIIGVTGCALLEYMTRMLFKNREALYLSSQQAEERLNDLVKVKDQLRIDAEVRAKDKSKFIATAVHDLRQPIQAISNTLLPIEMSLQRGDMNQAQALLGITRKSVALMHSQLGSILDLSQLETGSAQPSLRGLQLCHVLASALDQSSLEAIQRGVRLHVSEDSQLDEMWVYSDANFLLRIVCNLVQNSIKYCDSTKLEGSYVCVAISQSSGFVTIDVSDNGLGIDKSLIDQGALFRPFFQVKGQGMHQDRGVGLGLTIVKSLINVLPGHSLAIDSRVGEGSRFSIRLPTFEQSDLVDFVPLDGMQISGDILLGYYVLIVEDDALVRMATKHLLEFHGAICEVFESCADFFGRISSIEREPDVILSDFELPDGLTALDVFAAADRVFLNPNKLIITGEYLGQSELGAYGHVPVLYKPVTGVSLLEALVECSAQSVSHETATRPAF